MGAQGRQGVDGVQGRQGNQGFQGAPSTTAGPQGVQGAQGFQGAPSTTAGPQGVQGAQGFQGVLGAQGVLGVQGNQGFQGVLGAQGRQGVDGVQGRQGAQGFQGVVGVQGVQGAVGTVSIAGADTQILFNDGGSAVGANANLTFNKTTSRLQVVGDFNVSGSATVGNTDTYITPGAITLRANLTNGTPNGFINMYSAPTLGFSVLELGATSGNYIDFKTPYSDDYDHRIIADSGGLTIYAGSSTTSPNVLNIISGNVNIDSGTFFVDYLANEVGIGTTTPAANLDVAGNVLITYTGTTDALRITQLGAGNSFVVYDIANDTSPFVIDGTGDVIIGSGAAYQGVGATPTLQLHANSTLAGKARMSATYWGQALTQNPALELMKSGGTSLQPIGTHVLVASNESLGTIRWGASNGSFFSPAASIEGEIDGTPSATSVPTRLIFNTNSGGTAVSEKMRIQASGNVGIGITAPTSNLHVFGNANITSTMTVGGLDVLAQVNAAANTVRVSSNSASTITKANGINFVNTSSITISVSSGVNGNANVALVTVNKDVLYSNASANIAINSTTDVIVAQRDVLGVVAGDQLIVDGWFTILNNSGAAAVPQVFLDFDAGAFSTTPRITIGSITASATLIPQFNIRAVVDVKTTTASFVQTHLEGSLLAGSTSNAANTMVATHLQGKVWGQTGADLTGTCVVALKANSSTATATQTLRLHSFTIRKLTP